MGEGERDTRYEEGFMSIVIAPDIHRFDFGKRRIAVVSHYLQICSANPYRKKYANDSTASQ